MGKDQIPPKLVKIAGEFRVEPVTNIINCCLDKSTFPDLGKSVSNTNRQWWCRYTCFHKLETCMVAH